MAKSRIVTYNNDTMRCFSRVLNPQFKLDAGVESGAKVEVDDATIISVDLEPPNGTLLVETQGSSSPLTILINAGTEIKDANGDPLEITDLAPGIEVEIEGRLDPESGEITASEIKIES